jgi:hydroxylamine dehydrogenase
VGQDYYEAPTCATCHMSATPNQAITHDVGERISWTLRPPVSKTKDNWEQKRENMKDVCLNCHGKGFVDGHYAQFDGVVNLYNEKFAKPGAALAKLAKEKKLGEGQASFSNKWEWTWWEIWHHEGRRARHGAAMMGPDYTWWHGIYEVAQHFYFKYIPELRKFHDPELDAAIDEVLADEFHVWLNRPTADIKADIKSGAMQAKYAEMYQGPMGQ